MEISRIIHTLALPVTNQALADLALQVDQDRRLAERRGDYDRADELDAEIQALTELLS